MLCLGPQREDCFSPFLPHRLSSSEFEPKFLANYKFDFPNTDTIVFLSSRPFQWCKLLCIRWEFVEFREFKIPIWIPIEKCFLWVFLFLRRWTTLVLIKKVVARTQLEIWNWKFQKFQFQENLESNRISFYTNERCTDVDQKRSLWKCL